MRGIECSLCGEPIKDVDMAMLFFHEPQLGAPVIYLGVRHKRVCDVPKTNRSVELREIVEEKSASLARLVCTYKLSEQDVCYLLALLEEVMAL